MTPTMTSLRMRMFCAVRKKNFSLCSRRRSSKSQLWARKVLGVCRCQYPADPCFCDMASFLTTYTGLPLALLAALSSTMKLWNVGCTVLMSSLRSLHTKSFTCSMYRAALCALVLRRSLLRSEAMCCRIRRFM